MVNTVFSLSQKDFIELQGEYSLPIVALSVLIACVASFTALSMNKRAQKNTFFNRKIWIGLGAIAMGFGIWAMHFVGMSAFFMPIEMSYNIPLTIISVVPAMTASYLAFYIANRSTSSLTVSLVAAVFMGLGIVTMHYVGMMAMEMDAIYVYDKKLFILSIIVAIIASFLALSIFTILDYYVKSFLVQSIAAIIMGIAVSSMHYIGMFAVSYYVAPNYPFLTPISHGGGANFIVVSVTIGMTILLGLLLLTTIIDRYANYLANYYDTLTALPNHRQFERVLENRPTQQTLAIWHVHDLETINRANSYLYGDKVIQSVADIMKKLTPPMTELYRIEGNRFAFFRRDVEGYEKFQAAMERIAERLKEPLTVEGEELTLSAVCAWHSARNRKEVVKNYSNVLDVLGYPAIEYNHEVIYYDPEIHTYTFEREIIDDVVQAMKDREMYLVYQPKIDGKTREIKGVEALLRWNHRTYGLISPAVFVPVLEENARMYEVTDWIIEQICQQMESQSQAGNVFEQVSINIPGQYVTSCRLMKVLKENIAKYNIDANRIELEITETSFVKNITEAMRAVNILRKEGFSVALDDFGTGVSSLSYLKQMPISTLKIDKSFIDDVPMSSKDTSIIQAIIALGVSMDLNIVFEGVETAEQAEFLTSTCDDPIIQGYYFAKPMCLSELLVWQKKFQQV